MMSNFAVAEFIEAGLLLPFEDEDLERFVDPVGLVEEISILKESVLIGRKLLHQVMWTQLL